MSDSGAIRDLLFRAIERPFSDEPDPDGPINRWLTWLSGACPLWTFQTEEFMRLQETDLPVTDPLQDVIESVLRDEGWDRYGLVGDHPENYRLLENVYARRKELGKSVRSVIHACYAYTDPNGSRRVITEHPLGLRWLAEPPTITEYDEDGPVGSYTVYEEIGRELVRVLQAFNAAEPGSDERETAKARLDAFLEDVGARAPAHRPSADPPEEMLHELYRQGRELLNSLWTPRVVGPDGLSRDVLAAAGADQGDFIDWARRLAVPALSWPELQAIHQQATEAFTGSSDLKKPTARRMTIWVLAHRLGSPPERLAGKLGASSDYDYFKYAPNPVDEFVPNRE